MTSLDVNLLGFLVQVNATIGELMVNPNTPLKSHGSGGHRPSRVNACQDRLTRQWVENH